MSKQSSLAQRATLIPSVLSNRLCGDLLSCLYMAMWLNWRSIYLLRLSMGDRGTVEEIWEDHMLSWLSMLRHITQQAGSLPAVGVGVLRSCAGKVASSPTASKLGNKQDLIHVFTLGELCFLDLNRFEGRTYLPSEATPAVSLCKHSTLCFGRGNSTTGWHKLSL